MSLFDTILLIILGGFGLFGLWFGLVRTVGSLVSTIVGIYLATRYYEPAANWVIYTFGWGANFSKVLVFAVVFILIARLVGFVFWILDKLFGIVTKLPFIRGLDRLAGLLFGLIEGAFVIGIILYFIARFPLGTWFMSLLGNSIIAPPITKTITLLMPLIPDAIKMLKSVVEGII